MAPLGEVGPDPLKQDEIIDKLDFILNAKTDLDKDKIEEIKAYLFGPSA